MGWIWGRTGYGHLSITVFGESAMYGQTARKAILRVLKEAPELADLATRGEPPIPWSKIRDNRTRKLADRLLSELWMMGFAVSARTTRDHGPGDLSRNPKDHAEWRNSKLKPPPKTNQSDVESSGSKTA